MNILSVLLSPDKFYQSVHKERDKFFRAYNFYYRYKRIRALPKIIEIMSRMKP